MAPREDGEDNERSLLASRWFWIGGVVSVALWLVVIWIVWGPR